MSSRRQFIHKSILGASSLLLGSKASITHAGSKSLPHGNMLFAHSGDTSVLQEAKRNIPRIRQREAIVRLLDKNGRPLKNHDLHIEQLSHQFLFGDNNWQMSAMVRNGMENSDRLKYYRKRFSEVLNSLNTTVYWTERPRNDAAKTQDFQGEVQWDDFEESVNWALANNLTPKGHPMFWTVPKAIPEWLANYPPETRMKFIEVRIRNLAARFKNKVKVWDAVNEMLWEPHPKNLAARQWPYIESMENMTDYIAKVIGWAREEDPNALYTINDYGLSAFNQGEILGHDNSKVNAHSQRRRYIELIKRLGDAGFSPNLMGIQCHTGWLNPSEQMAFYDEMSEAGIPLTVTEFWARASDLSKKTSQIPESEEWKAFDGKKGLENMSPEELEHYRDEYVINYLTCAFGHPNIDSFYFWGFMGMGVNFTNSYNSSHELRPIFHKVKDLIHSEWKTKLKLQTDESGTVKFRGFCGDYSLKPKPANGPGTGYRFSLDKNQNIHYITLKTLIS